MKDQFVTYEIAKRMKELGFNNECLAYYNSMPDGRNASLIIEKETEITKIVRAKGDILLIPAPLWQQAIDWLRTRHNIFSLIKPIRELYPTPQFFGYKNEFDETIYKTYEQARQAAIEKALTIITK